MNKEQTPVLTEQAQDELYEKEYIPAVHRFGTFTML